MLAVVLSQTLSRHRYPISPFACSLQPEVVSIRVANWLNICICRIVRRNAMEGVIQFDHYGMAPILQNTHQLIPLAPEGTLKDDHITIAWTVDTDNLIPHDRWLKDGLIIE